MTELTAQHTAQATAPLVQGSGLKELFPVKGGLFGRTRAHVHAVDGVDLEVFPGESVGLVGESGSGKSTLGRLMTRLLEPTDGTLLFDGKDITHMGQRGVRPLRRHMQMVFQDPYTSLAPYSTVGSSLAEPLRTHTKLSGSEIDDRIDDLLRRVSLNPEFKVRYPHEFSGGHLQRISIARALATNPRLVVLDEPVSSLDVSTQAEVINLLADLRAELGMAYLFVAHDLAVVRHVSDRIAVMYLGRIVEDGPTDAVYENPKHPYTQALLSAIPLPDPVVQRSREQIILQGEVPSPISPPSGCRFRTRCPVVMPVCAEIDPISKRQPDGVAVACHRVNEPI